MTSLVLWFLFWYAILCLISMGVLVGLVWIEMKYIHIHRSDWDQWDDELDDPWRDAEDLDERSG